MPSALIIEDEPIAAQNLMHKIAQAKPELQQLGPLQSVEESVAWFLNNPAPDVVFMDIHLADGLAFRIFDHIHIETPIIFTTAYDHSALDAFKVNSIDYLLKPISSDDLLRALGKLDHWSRQTPNDTPVDGGLSLQLLATLNQHYRHYKKNLLIPHHDRLIPLDVNEIAFIYLDNKVAELHTFSQQRYALDESLDDIMSQLDPAIFFRVNRQVIVAHKAVQAISQWIPGKYTISLTVPTPERISLPKAKVAEFKSWLQN